MEMAKCLFTEQCKAANVVCISLYHSHPSGPATKRLPKSSARAFIKHKDRVN